MLKNLIDSIQNQSSVASVIISIAIMLFLGFAMTRITKKLKLPNVTAYIFTGILIGPYVFNLIPSKVAQGMDFITDIALAFIAFSVGEYFKFSTLKKSGKKVLIITVCEALLASILVFTVMYYVIGLDLAFSAVLGALASATAPASTIMTIRQTGAKGDFVDTLLQVVALDDVVGLVAYSIAISIALASTAGVGGVTFAAIGLPIVYNILVLVLGGLFGLLLKLLLTKRSTDNRLIVSLAVLFAFCGICAMLDVSPLLGCMSMGMVYINVTNDDKLFKQLNYFSPPILLLFFVKSGLGFKLDSLFSSNSFEGTSLLLVGIVYFSIRIIGKYFGAYIGCFFAKKDKEVRNYLGLALIPQAGVAIGLAAMGARILGGDAGSNLNTIILASSVLYELIGPACSKLALYLSKSYSTKLEDLVEVKETTEVGTKKTPVELLIERIQKIQEELPKRNVPLVKEQEIVFTQAAEEYLESMQYPKNRQLSKK